MQEDVTEKSGNEMIKELGKRYKTYRKRMGYTQKDIANRSGLSIFTISTFENGTFTGITMASFIKLLRAMDMLEEIDKLLPEPPVSPKALFKKQKKSK
jgi:transcriptional regulator with XRE-family HTH domain